MRDNRTTRMVFAAIFIAIILLLAFTPGLGYIPIGVIRITTVHIPVILGAIFLGPKYGALLGGVFGFTSFITNTFSPVLTSFVFTPFYTLGEARGNLWSLVVCFVPRIIIGVVAYYVYVWMERLLQSRKGHRTISFVVSGITGSLVNTILVMNFIYIFFGEQYAAVNQYANDALYGVIMTVIGINGIPEAVGAAIITSAVGTILFKLCRTIGLFPIVSCKKEE